MFDVESLGFPEEILILYCKHCGESFKYDKYENGCCPNCGKLHSEYRPKKKESFPLCAFYFL